MRLQNTKALSIICLSLPLLLYGCVRSPTSATCPQSACVVHSAHIRQPRWQHFFLDPTVKRLICLALRNNCLGARELIGQVAHTYLTEVELNELICNALDTINTRQEIHRILKLR